MNAHRASKHGLDFSILHVSVSDGGGAGRAAFRLHQGLLELGLRSSMLVDVQSSQGPTVTTRNDAVFGGLRTRLRRYLDKAPLCLFRKRRRLPWSVNWIPVTTARHTNNLRPDVVNLHWIGDGCVSLYELNNFNAPLVWTLHDMWPFTGGCHYDEGCGRYRQSCGGCPQLASSRQYDLSRWVWNQKSKHWRDARLTIVAPSRWIAACARESSLFSNRRVEHIPNGLDGNLYRPKARSSSRDLFDLPQDRALILFGAASGQQDSRKGFQYLRPAIELLASRLGACTLVTFGDTMQRLMPPLPVDVRHLGPLRDESNLAAVYSAADVFVAPSIQDNLPNTVMEALACGTPCVAFDIGGMPDMIEHRRNGYLAQPFQTDDLAQGIAWVLEDPERWRKLSERARQKVEQHFTLSRQAQRYRTLYEELLEAHVAQPSMDP